MRKIHQIWLGPTKPSYFQKVIASRENWGKFTFRVWMDVHADNLKFPKYFSGNLASTALWQNAPNLAFRADILRYLILEKMGGLYIDFDYEFLRDPGLLFENSDLILAAEGRWFTNSFLGGQKNHELFRLLNSQIWNQDTYNKMRKGESILELTGPYLLNKIICDNNFHLKPSSTLIPSHLLILDSSFIRNKRQAKKNSILFNEDGTPLGSVAQHLYAGSWTSFINKIYNKWFRKILSKIKPVSRIRQLIRIVLHAS